MSKPLTLWIEQSCISEMKTGGADFAPLETGGILLGYWAVSGDEAVVTAILGPGPNAVHSRKSFIPDSDFHNQEIAKIYEQSGRNVTYLGDWHTHPGGYARMSKQDRNTLLKIGATAEARAPNAVMLIAAGEEGNWQIKAWCCVRRPIGFLPSKIAALRVEEFVRSG